MDKNNCTEKRRKRYSFTTAERLHLAEQVKENPCIWDLNHPKHFNINNVSSAWGDISVAMEKSVKECKDNWAALRDAKRYRLKLAAKRKIGDADGVDFDDYWKFGKAMQFLPDNSKKTKSLDSSSSDGSKSKYIHNENRSSIPVVDAVLVENLNALIEFQLQRNNEKRVRSKNKEKALPLKYQTLYAHMDTMLSRLPQEKVDRISNKILSFITEELYNNE